FGGQGAGFGGQGAGFGGQGAGFDNDSKFEDSSDDENNR
ncbi:MAG TPA: RNA chaperone Hfq, partial [Acinetobacter sp.]|nr:RNA chaperone Hfq [Acinetobacter sp.]